MTTDEEILNKLYSEGVVHPMPCNQCGSIECSICFHEVKRLIKLAREDELEILAPLLNEAADKITEQRQEIQRLKDVIKGQQKYMDNPHCTRLEHHEKFDIKWGVVNNQNKKLRDALFQITKLPANGIFKAQEIAKKALGE